MHFFSAFASVLILSLLLRMPILLSLLWICIISAARFSAQGARHSNVAEQIQLLG